MSRLLLVVGLAVLAPAIWAAPPATERATDVTPAAVTAGTDLRARYPQAWSWQARKNLLEALVANDNRETTDFLLPFLDRPEPPAGDDHGTWSIERDAVHAHLWRTGRATAAGLCPSGPPRAVPELAVRASDGSIGTRHPLRLVDIARDGAWTLLCQARRDSNGDGRIRSDWHVMGYATGDQMQAYLVPESGPGWRIDRLLGADPTGRFVAVRQGLCLHLVDLRDATTLVLPEADLRDVAEGPYYPRLAFAPDGQSLAYLRGGRAPRIVVRDLPSGRETVLVPGAGFVRNLRFDREGRAVLFEGIPGTTAVVQPLAAPWADCGGRGSCIVHEYEGPLVRRRIALGGGPARDVPEFIHEEEPVAEALGPATVYRPRGYDFVKGIWATRADGARLGVSGNKREPFDDGPVPRGPLRWRRRVP